MNLDIYEKEILRAMYPLKGFVTPAKVAEATGIHPATAKSRMTKLYLHPYRLLEGKSKGTRMVYRIKPNVKKQINL